MAAGTSTTTIIATGSTTIITITHTKMNGADANQATTQSTVTTTIAQMTGATITTTGMNVRPQDITMTGIMIHTVHMLHQQTTQTLSHGTHISMQLII